MTETFRAWMISKDPEFHPQLRVMQLEDLPAGDVTIRVHYSSVNYKDALAMQPDGRVVRHYPMVPGVDLAGVVQRSSDRRFREGDQVIATGYGLGTDYFGGFSEYARLPADWVIPKPVGLSLRETMILGTAGFTAGLSVTTLQKNGMTPAQGPVLVTGATGGVGSVAVDILSTAGFQVVASTGKASAHGWLAGLGAQAVISRDEVQAPESKALNRERWACAVDTVGGGTLASVLKSLQYGGAVTACGLTGGSDLPTSVFPFILRGVSLLGIDSVACPFQERTALWERLGTDLKPRHLEALLAGEIDLEGLPAASATLLSGTARGRLIMRM